MLGKRKRFEIDQDWLESSLVQFEKLKDQQGSKVQLDPNQVTGDRKVNSEFICVICSCVAWDMLECNNCDIVSCCSCIADWHKKKQSCPSCQQNSQFRKLNRNLKNNFKSLRYIFRCNQNVCRETFDYSDAANHMKACN